MFWMINKENSFPIGTLIWRPGSICCEKVQGYLPCILSIYELYFYRVGFFFLSFSVKNRNITDRFLSELELIWEYIYILLANLDYPNYKMHAQKFAQLKSMNAECLSKLSIPNGLGYFHNNI